MKIKHALVYRRFNHEGVIRKTSSLVSRLSIPAIAVRRGGSWAFHGKSTRVSLLKLTNKSASNRAFVSAFTSQPLDSHGADFVIATRAYTLISPFPTLFRCSRISPVARRRSRFLRAISRRSRSPIGGRSSGCSDRVASGWARTTTTTYVLCMCQVHAYVFRYTTFPAVHGGVEVSRWLVDVREVGE